MNNKIGMKYAPLIFFILLLLIGWLNEAFFGEGVFNRYLHEEGHYGIYGAVKFLFLVIIFLVGYKGLSYLHSLWVKQLWIIWYLLVLISSGIRVLYLVIFHYRTPSGILNAISYFYVSGETPFPYLLIWLLWIIANNRIKSKSI